MPIQCPDGKGVKDILAVDGLGNQMSIKEVWLSDANKDLTKRWSKGTELDYLTFKSGYQAYFTLPTINELVYIITRFTTDNDASINCSPFGQKPAYPTHNYYAIMQESNPGSIVCMRYLNSDEGSSQGGGSGSQTYTVRSKFVGSTLPIFIGCYNNNGVPTSFYHGRFNYMEVHRGDSDSGELIYKFVPYKIGDSIGLMDTVNNVFYLPTQGQVF